MTAKKYLLVVGGATASGKTALALALARQFNTVILSADSRQFYREMSIGTAKPDADTLATVPHYFINSLSIEQSYSAGDFERDALELLQRLFQERDMIVVAGGSGLFIKALCEGFDDFPEVSEAARQRVQEWYASEGLAGLQQRLREADPVYYQQVDKDNPQRLRRALLVCESTGRPYTDFRRGHAVERPFESIYLMPHWPRDTLYARINQRVADMVAQGLVAEARSLFPKEHLNALQTVGYQELFDHFRGQTDLDTAIAAIAQHTRNYAKRQLTWFRNQGSWKRFPGGDTDTCIRYIEWLIRHGLRLQSERHTGLDGLLTETLSFVREETVIAGVQCDQTRRSVTVHIRDNPDFPEARTFLLHECLYRYDDKPIFVAESGQKLTRLLNLHKN